jgi:uncharacterized protein
VTPQEEQLLQSLVEKVNGTQLQEKDQDAELFLNQNLASNPDSIYILSQTVLVQNIALEQAKAQIAQLQQQLQQSRQPAHTTSFLGNLLGRHEPAPEPQPAYPAPVPYPPNAQPGFQPVQQGPFQPGQPVQYVPAGSPPFAPAYSSGPSFLRGAMQTAAGVAAGALAFEGVESVLHGLSGGHEWGGPGFGMGPGLIGGGYERPEETVINNYYDQPGGEREHHEAEQHFHESADQSDAHVSDASYNTTGDDRTSDDRANVDNADDGSFNDNSGNYDDNGGSADGDDFADNDFGGGDSNFQ